MRCPCRNVLGLLLFWDWHLALLILHVPSATKLRPCEILLGSRVFWLVLGRHWVCGASSPSRPWAGGGTSPSCSLTPCLPFISSAFLLGKNLHCQSKQKPPSISTHVYWTLGKCHSHTAASTHVILCELQNPGWYYCLQLNRWERLVPVHQVTQGRSKNECKSEIKV